MKKSAASTDLIGTILELLNSLSSLYDINHSCYYAVHYTLDKLIIEALDRDADKEI